MAEKKRGRGEGKGGGGRHPPGGKRNEGRRDYSLSGWLRPVSVALLSATHFLDRSIAKTDRSSASTFFPISTGRKWIGRVVFERFIFLNGQIYKYGKYFSLACRLVASLFPPYLALEATYAFVSRFPARENGRKMEEEERMAEHIDKHWTDAAGVIDTCPQEGRRWRRPKVTPRSLENAAMLTFPLAFLYYYSAHVASDVVIAQSSRRYVIEHNRRSRKLGGANRVPVIR